MANRYSAFISYAHADEREASRLMRRLETYRVPRRLVGSEGARGAIGARLGRFFRDRDELSSAGDLTATIREVLADSDALIVVCSPAAASSKWVNAEIEAFREAGPDRPVFCYLVAGEPGPESFPAALWERDADGDRVEPLAADARREGDGRHRAFLKLVAGLLGVRFDRLARRDAQRRQRRMAIVMAAALAGMAVTTWLAVTAHLARNEAQRRQAQTEELLGFMLGDLHQKLRGVGRLDLMASVSDKVLELFAQTDPGDLTDTELARQSQALVQIGQVRVEQRQYDTAVDAFQRAYRRSAELVARHPDEGGMLFDRSQAEYWIGYAAWQRGDLEAATRWLTQYRDSTLALTNLDPSRADWRQESAYGLHNLAVLRVERGDLEGARALFETKLKALEELAVQSGRDAELAFSITETISWLGTIAEREGNLDRSAGYFREQATRLKALIDSDPRNARWSDARAKSLHFQGVIAGITGEPEQARRIMDEVIAVRVALNAQDPDNQSWSRFLKVAQLVQAELIESEDGDPAATERIVQPVLDGLPEASEIETINLLWCKGLTLRARAALRDGNHATAGRYAERAVGYARRLKGGDDDNLAAMAEALVVAGRVRAVREDAPSASEYWRSAREMLSARIPGTRYWRLLDPWVRVNRLLGDGDAAASAIATLDSMHYQPLQPWPPPADGPSNPQLTQGEVHE